MGLVRSARMGRRCRSTALFAMQSGGMPNRRGTSVLADSEPWGTVCEGPQKRRRSRETGNFSNANRPADGSREKELIGAINFGEGQLLWSAIPGAAALAAGVIAVAGLGRCSVAVRMSMNRCSRCQRQVAVHRARVERSVLVRDKREPRREKRSYRPSPWLSSHLEAI
jgi:hypothetical protein